MSIYEYHYAPISGGLLCLKDGMAEKVTSWPGRHALMECFLAKRANKEIVFLRSQNYGHELFHGRHGRVDIYGVPNIHIIGG